MIDFLGFNKQEIEKSIIDRFELIVKKYLILKS